MERTRSPVVAEKHDASQGRGKGRRKPVLNTTFMMI